MKSAMTGLVQVLVLNAVKQCGNSSVENVMSVIEENLTAVQFGQVQAFLKWAFFDWDNRMFGHGNFQARWNEWLSVLGEQWRTGQEGEKPRIRTVFPKTGRNRFHQYHWMINCRCGGKMRGSFGTLMVENHIIDIRKFCEAHENCK